MMTATNKMTVDWQYVDMEFTTRAKNSCENAYNVDFMTSPQVKTPPSVNVITCVSIFGILGLLMNIAVLVVLFQKKNRKVATNRYLVNLAISESTYFIYIHSR